MNGSPSNFTAIAYQRETLIHAAYYAPRGRQRLYMLGNLLATRYLLPSDLLIGIIGAEGSGKSTLIRGLFPGLELTNDDEGINNRRAPLLDFDPEDAFSGHTFHLDARYELGLRQMHEILEAINHAIAYGRRVVCEHFDLIHRALGYNAQILFGIGEEVIVARPSVFGPYPEGIRHLVERTIKFRLMAHSAEDITSYIVEKEYGYTRPYLHSDVKHGFVINFQEKPDFRIDELERKVREVIRLDLPIQPAGTDQIRIGDWIMRCSGTRTHVRSTGQIRNFRLFPEFKYMPTWREYLLIGMVGDAEVVGYEEISAMVDQPGSSSDTPPRRTGASPEI